jgi:hypothetical protein
VGTEGGAGGREPASVRARVMAYVKLPPSAPSVQADMSRDHPVSHIARNSRRPHGTSQGEVTCHFVDGPESTRRVTGVGFPLRQARLASGAMSGPCRAAWRDERKFLTCIVRRGVTALHLTE